MRLIKLQFQSRLRVRTTFGRKSQRYFMYTEQTSPSSVINLSKTYGKITRPLDAGASNIYALLQVVERLEKYPDRRLRFPRA